MKRFTVAKIIISTNFLLKNLTSYNIPLLASRLKVHFLTKIFNVLQNSDPILLNSLSSFSSPTHRFPLRSIKLSAECLHIPKYNKSSYGGKTFEVLASSYWNPLPECLKNCATLNNFKKISKIYCFDF